MKTKLIQLLLIFGVAGVVHSLSFAQNSSSFQDARLALKADRLLAYRTALKNLKLSFDSVCGDTFCEGDFSNLTSVDLTCGMNVKTGQLTQCSWTFAGAAAFINPRDGSVDTNLKTLKVCNLDVAGVPVTEFSSALNGNPAARQAPDSIHVKLKGKSSSIYDQLTGCL